MGFGNDGDAMHMEGENDFDSATVDEAVDMEADGNDFDSMDKEQGGVLQEMGMMPEDTFADEEE